MAFAFERDEAVHDAAARIAREQLDAALGWLAVASGSAGGDDASDGSTGHRTGVSGGVDPEAPVEVAVHEARKCCKRVRGLVRLVRPAMEDAYTATNRAARDAARELSPIRDAHALLDTFDALVAARADQVPADGLGRVRAELAVRAEAATQDVTTNLDRIHAAAALLLEARDGIPDWPLDDLDAADRLDAVAAGIARTAGRASSRFAEVAASEGGAPDELLHQWRKRVKYSWYHVSLLEPASPTLLGTHADLLHDLSDALGDDHDLVVLTGELRGDPDAFGPPEEIAAAMLLLDGTRADLQRRAVGVGARLHAEDPDAFGRRMVAHLRAWWRHGPEPRAGEIGAVLGAGSTGLEDATVGQLRDLAREHDVAGRSEMNRAGLLAALRAAGAAR